MNRRLFLAATAALAGCAGVRPGDYAAEKPVLELARYFNGVVDGWGMVQDRSGRLLRRFHVRIDCTWQGNQGVLDETFEWSDGTREKRIWKVTRLGGGRYTGTAGDVIGEARGEAAGNALQWRYVLKLPEAQGGWEVDIDDWMYLVDERTLLNRSVVTKLGIRFAEITIAFRKA
jgi:hypothetical protein